MMFTEPLAAKIIKGEKTATRRVMKDNPRSLWFKGGCKYDVGLPFKVNPGRGVPHVAQAEVTAIYKQAPDEIGLAQAAQEGFGSRREFWVAFTRINRGADISDLVWVVEFKLIGPVCPKCHGCEGCNYCDGMASCSWCYGTGIEPTQRARDFVARVERELAEAGE